MYCVWYSFGVPEVLKALGFALRILRTTSFGDCWVSLCAFCESHRSAIGTVNAVGTVMEIPALHQPTEDYRRLSPSLSAQLIPTQPTRTVCLMPSA